MYVQYFKFHVLLTVIEEFDYTIVIELFYSLAFSIFYINWMRTCERYTIF